MLPRILRNGEKVCVMRKGACFKSLLDLKEMENCTLDAEVISWIYTVLYIYIYFLYFKISWNAYIRTIFCDHTPTHAWAHIKRRNIHKKYMKTYLKDIKAFEIHIPYQQLISFSRNKLPDRINKKKKNTYRSLKHVDWLVTFIYTSILTFLFRNKL